MDISMKYFSQIKFFTFYTVYIQRNLIVLCSLICDVRIILALRAHTESTLKNLSAIRF